jgi:hypothetical protein
MVMSLERDGFKVRLTAEDVHRILLGCTSVPVVDTAIHCAHAYAFTKALLHQPPDVFTRHSYAEHDPCYAGEEPSPAVSRVLHGPRSQLRIDSTRFLLLTQVVWSRVSRFSYDIDTAVVYDPDTVIFMGDKIGHIMMRRSQLMTPEIVPSPSRGLVWAYIHIGSDDDDSDDSDEVPRPPQLQRQNAVTASDEEDHSDDEATRMQSVTQEARLGPVTFPDNL